MVKGAKETSHSHQQSTSVGFEGVWFQPTQTDRQMESPQMFGSREPKPGKLDDQRILMDIIGFAMFYCFVCVCVFLHWGLLYMYLCLMQTLTGVV